LVAIGEEKIMFKNMSEFEVMMLFPLVAAIIGFIGITSTGSVVRECIFGILCVVMFYIVICIIYRSKNKKNDGCK
jgi:uncharacterized membrane protein YtjA (UPF0391 family)